MGLLDQEGAATDKMDEVVEFATQNHFHVLGVSEAALHGLGSRVKRVSPTTTSSIKHHLAIPGYKVILPETWRIHAQARLIIYIKDTVSHKSLNCPPASMISHWSPLRSGRAHARGL